MSFRIIYNIPETAIEFLIKFMKLVLEEIGDESYRDFPGSLYLAKKVLELNDNFQSFVLCTKCHKLYGKQDVENFCKGESLSIMNCNHVEFSNSSSQRSHICNILLLSQVDASIQPELIFPFSGVWQQLTTMFRQPGFKKSLRHWSNREQFDNILTDIYDGQVWKTFKETSNDNSLKFFGQMLPIHILALC